MSSHIVDVLEITFNYEYLSFVAFQGSHKNYFVFLQQIMQSRLVHVVDLFPI